MRFIDTRFSETPCIFSKCFVMLMMMDQKSYQLLLSFFTFSQRGKLRRWHIQKDNMRFTRLHLSHYDQGFIYLIMTIIFCLRIQFHCDNTWRLHLIISTCMNKKTDRNPDGGIFSIYIYSIACLHLKATLNKRLNKAFNLTWDIMQWVLLSYKQEGIKYEMTKQIHNICHPVLQNFMA